ncbi:hypothetical protein GLYMA_18G150800v4 [Glycine max]|uniref:Dof zinc finger protein n=1 Tax=Glycine max TaxID=3847 RepID=K7MSC7_SOYBN|nr:dof zinc finger protein DOF5.7 [Glycine max]KAG4921493.1 hypothetical protein JHK86_050306 [Glycine max]KAG5094780.1 hypothetical protein JHK84_050368 [Glycine max]KAH1154621.1 hypothetical protein GYH30_050058 [Glycine max]KRG99513.1 hypothetical protein GLYMA_18G150800v4 [Glycine max]|eukprot:XP_006603380.1 dof zinc finger protein DOF5.7 [Glycine max]
MVPPPENMAAPKDQDATQGRKITTTTTRPAPEQGVKCPRCDSSNTKFCYYNNYSLTQPRHFCKTCRRYWTNGGALRSVPIGGGCRKNKRAVVKPSSSSSSSSPRLSTTEFSLRGLNVPPSVEFNLGALPFPSRLNTNHHIPTIINTGLFNNNQLSPFLDVKSALFQLDAPPAALSNSLMGIAPPSAQNNNFWALGRSQSSTLSDPLNSTMQSMQQSLNVHSSLASSIESLSCVNRDLHLKMQQQRYATMMSGGDTHHKGDENSGVSFPQTVNGFENQKLVMNPVMFQKPVESLPAGSAVTEGPSGASVTTVAPPTEWFFGNSSFPSTGNGGGNGNNNINININDANNNWSDALAWGNFQQQQQQYSALP